MTLTQTNSSTPTGTTAENVRPIRQSISESSARGRVSELIDGGIGMGRIAVEAGVSSADLKRWVDGAKADAVNDAVAVWLSDIDDEMRAHADDFTETPTARRIMRAFDQARQAKDDRGQRGIALIYGASGIGKSKTARYYAKRENTMGHVGSTNVVYVQLDGENTTWTAALNAVVGSARGAYGLDAYKERNLRQWITQHVPEGGMLIFDEAQLLPTRRLDELRIFPDECGIAVAFMGNTAGYKALESAKIAQITSRVGGARVVADKPTEGDVDALLEAWNLRGRKLRELAVMIGTQDGGLRFLGATVQAARVYAKASGRDIDERTFKAAAVSVGAWGIQ